MDSSDDNSDGPSTSTKKIRKKSYAHKYKAEWEQIPEFQSWIRPSNQGITFFLMFGVCKRLHCRYGGGKKG